MQHGCLLHMVAVLLIIGPGCQLRHQLVTRSTVNLAACAERLARRFIPIGMALAICRATVAVHHIPLGVHTNAGR